MGVDHQELASGKGYEELEAGGVHRHAITRRVCEADRLLFSALNSRRTGMMLKRPIAA